MSDSQGPKSKGIPSWQRQNPSSPSNQPDAIPPQEQAEQQQPSEPRTSLIKTASDFLKDESIRDAPTEQKKLFLESKGLSKAETDNLLGTQHTPEQAADAPEEDPEPKQQQNEASESPSPPNPQSSEPTPNQDPPPPQSTTDQPPIITYPEFLLHAQSPQSAPFLTFPRLLTSLSLLTGTMATIYGTSAYFIEPMSSSLTTARHALFSTAGTNLDNLNEKLEDVVSEVPARLLSLTKEEEEEEEDEEEEEGEEEMEDSDAESTDGARFFRRSRGTQTSPTRLSWADGAGVVAEAGGEGGGGGLGSAVEDEVDALLSVYEKLADLHAMNGNPANPLKDSMSDLRAYLERLPQEKYTAVGVRKVWRRGMMVDAVADLKAEIKGVKGVLLSARNFPSGVPAR